MEEAHGGPLGMRESERKEEREEETWACLGRGCGVVSV